MLLERRRRLRHPDRPVRPLPRIDLNQPAHQLALFGSVLGLLVVLVLLSVTGYQAYHFTESVKFCGLVCHQVMKPQYTAHQRSPHARVACVDCHVGSGADWYVRAKLNGIDQVYSVLTGDYERPIPVPVKDLRPAQDTCESCHWPAKSFGAVHKTVSRYLSDETNSPWKIQMLMRVGGGDPTRGPTEGIHWHMNIKNDIEYIAADEQRQVIPWVRVTDPEGRVTEYASTEQPLTPEQRAAADVRRMDCIDCHNRPSHVYRPPDQAVDAALDSGAVDRRLPYVKREAVRLLAAEYATEPEALEAIRAGLRRYYADAYPQLAAEQAAAIEQAAGAIQEIYRANMFPEMRTDWRAYADHAGHLNSDGCFRCHDGLHRSAEGRIITNDCNACHAILAQGPEAGLEGAALQPQPFQHPVDLGMDVTQLKCSQCHRGTGDQ
jgi:hypothetical protein